MSTVFRSLVPVCLLAAVAPVAAAETVTVFAAASLKEAFDENGTIYCAKTGDRIVVSYAASSMLARQIEAGAPADLFVSADVDWMDFLEQRRLIKPGTRQNLLGNRLVLIVPAENPTSVSIEPGFPIARLIGAGRIAMADPDTVPAGKYGKAALEALGVWRDVRAKVAAAENVRAALVLVSRGGAPFGIVYRTDAVADPRVRVAGTFPENAHPPIVYPVAITALGKPPAERFLKWLSGPEARVVFEKHGFHPSR